MGLFDQFPYTNFHELNLDWILKALKELEHTIEEFVAINALKYADPIQWDITSQYEKNTIVIDPQTGTAYISVQPVPSGVSIYNTDYWTEVFSLERFIAGANRNFTSKVDNETLTATFNSNVGEWVIWNDLLYTVTSPITAGDAYVVDGNITRTTVYAMYLSLLNTISTEVTTRLSNDKTLASNFTSRADYDTDTATFSTPQGGWLIWNYKVYTAAAPISVGDSYVVDSNITPVTVESIWVSLIDQISALDTRVSNQISALDTRVSHLEMNNIIIMGDSYANGVTNGGQSPDITSWAEYLRVMLGKSEDECHIIGVNSGAFAASADTLRFAKVIETEDPAISAKFAADTVSHIIVCAGANEILYTYGDVLNGVVAFCNYCKTKYPNAKVYIGMIGYGGQGIINGINTLYGYHDISLCGYIDGARSCDNAVYLNGIENQHKEYYRGYHTGSDGVHPNAFGYLSLAQGIKQALISGSCDIHSVSENLVINPDSGLSINQQSMYSVVDNDTITWKNIGDMVITGLNVTDYVAAGTVPILLGLVTNGSIIGRADTTSHPIPIYYYDTNDALHTATGLIYIDSERLYIAIKEASTAAWLATSVKSIYISSFEFKLVSTMC